MYHVCFVLIGSGKGGKDIGFGLVYSNSALSVGMDDTMTWS